MLFAIRSSSIIHGVLVSGYVRNRKLERLTLESIGSRTQKLSEVYPDQFS